MKKLVILLLVLALSAGLAQGWPLCNIAGWVNYANGTWDGSGVNVTLTSTAAGASWLSTLTGANGVYGLIIPPLGCISGDTANIVAVAPGLGLQGFAFATWTTTSGIVQNVTLNETYAQVKVNVTEPANDSLFNASSPIVVNYSVNASGSNYECNASIALSNATNFGYYGAENGSREYGLLNDTVFYDFFTIQGYANGSTNVTVSVNCTNTSGEDYVYNVTTVQQPVDENWSSISWPEGAFEPYNSTAIGTHRHLINITFVNFSAYNASNLSCMVLRSDNSTFYFNETVNYTYFQNYSLTYNLSFADKPFISKFQPWLIQNCSLYRADHSLAYFNDSSYINESLMQGLSPKARYIAVHNNSWSQFETVEDDAYRAGQCFLGFPKYYFNNSYYCDYVGDVAFSITMASSMNLEGDCHDGIDNDGNGDVDCDDRYCQGITYSCMNHSYAGDPFTGTCTNGLCTDSRTIGGQPLVYTYTRYVQPGGTLKVRVDGGNYGTTQPVTYAITKLGDGSSAGFTASDNYSYAGGTQLPETSWNNMTYQASDSNGMVNNVDEVLWVNLSVGVFPNGTTTNFSLYFVQYGVDLLIDGIPLIITDGAPNNWNESNLGWAVGSSLAVGGTCGDGVDNELDGAGYDCGDLDCNMSYVGGTNCTGGAAYCVYADEANTNNAWANKTCWDCFDNDQQGGTDCQDSDCDLLPGNYLNATHMCHVQGEGRNVYDAAFYNWTDYACVDSFNNDADAKVDCWDTGYCWGRGGTSTTLPCPMYENNTINASWGNNWCNDGVDNNYKPGTDCSNEYDCSAVLWSISYGNNTFVCTSNEAEDNWGNPSNASCFDNVDNDLDNPSWTYWGPANNIDCQDPDCNGVQNPGNPSQICQSAEYIQADPLLGDPLFCADTIDNDFDHGFIPGTGDPAFGGTDCTDSDCFQNFNLCGPCPAIEDYAFTACANGQDDDADNTAPGFSNGYDCSDADCLYWFGSMSKAARCRSAGQENGSYHTCDNGFDDDRDGSIDCADANCNGQTGPYGGTCNPNENTVGTCSDDYDNNRDNYVDCVDSSCYGVGPCGAINWTSTSCKNLPTYSGWNQIAATTISTNAMTGLHESTNFTIQISGTSAYSSVTVTVGDGADPSKMFPFNATSCVLSGGGGSLKWVASQPEVGQLQDTGGGSGAFTVTLTCNQSTTNFTKNYYVFVSNTIGATPESGGEYLTAIVYEEVPTFINKVEVEPMTGANVINVRRGDSFRVRALPQTDESRVCRCLFDLNGATGSSSNCVYSSAAQTSDAVGFSIRAAAEDGSDNTGAWSPPIVASINVQPVMDSFAVSRYYWYSNESVSWASSFSTGATDSFTGCTVYLEYENGTALTSVPLGMAGSTATCSGSLPLTGYSDGTYFLRIVANDNDGDSVEAYRQVFNICDVNASTPACELADFDLDGAPDWCPFVASPMNCTIPTVDTHLTEDTLLCSGTYYLNDAGLPGILLVDAADITIDCGGATLIGYASGYGINNNGNSATFKNCHLQNYSVVAFGSGGGLVRVEDSSFSACADQCVTADGTDWYLLETVFDESAVNFSGASMITVAWNSYVEVQGESGVGVVVSYDNGTGYYNDSITNSSGLAGLFTLENYVRNSTDVTGFAYQASVELPSGWDYSLVHVLDLYSSSEVSWTQGSIEFTAESDHDYQVYQSTVTPTPEPSPHIYGPPGTYPGTGKYRDRDGVEPSVTPIPTPQFEEILKPALLLLPSEAFVGEEVFMTLVDAKTGEPLVYRKINVVSPSGKEFVLRTNADGKTSFVPDEEGVYKFKLISEEYLLGATSAKALRVLPGFEAAPSPSPMPFEEHCVWFWGWLECYWWAVLTALFVLAVLFLLLHRWRRGKKVEPTKEAVLDEARVVAGEAEAVLKGVDREFSELGASVASQLPAGESEERAAKSLKRKSRRKLKKAERASTKRRKAHRKQKRGKK